MFLTRRIPLFRIEIARSMFLGFLRFCPRDLKIFKMIKIIVIWLGWGRWSLLSLLRRFVRIKGLREIDKMIKIKEI